MPNQIIEDRKKQLWITVCVAFAAFMCTLDIYIVNISLPSIAGYFKVGTSDVSWITLSYLLVISSILLLFGKLCDKYGLKNIFILGYGVFTFGSLLCGISPKLGFLIFSRCIQAVGASMMITCVFAAVPKYIPVKRRGRIFGLLSTAAAGGISVGAPVGGFITTYLSWHWIFLINIPVGIAAILVVRKSLPAALPASERPQDESFDILGAVLSFLAFGTLIYAINRGEEIGWSNPLILALFAFFAVVFTLFIFREKFAKDPMLHLGLFTDIDFSLVNLATMFSFLFYAGNLFLLPFYLILVKGLNSARAGLVILIYSLIYMVLSPYLGRLSDRVKPRYLCAGGMLLAAVACILFVMTIKTAGLACLAIYLVILAVAYSFFIPPNNTQAMNLAPEEKQGVASGVFTMIKNLALVLGVGIFETVFSSSIPHKIAAADTGKAFANIPHDMLYTGFRRAYILGIILCLISAAFSFLAKKNT